MKLNIDYTLRRFAVTRWLMRRLKLTFEHDKWVGFAAFSGVWAASTMLALFTVYGSPTGLGTAIDLFLVYFFNTAAIGVVSLLIAFVLSLLAIPLPRFLTGGALYTGFISCNVLIHSRLGTVMSITITVIYVIAAVIFGLFISVLWSRSIPWHAKRFSISLAVVLVCGMMILTQFHSTAAYVSTDLGFVQPFEGPSPAQKGPYNVRSFSYGSGKDNHRSEFGDHVSIVTSSVDASNYTTEWTWKRKLFWGFDVTELPINGRVWMPEGEGSFPLVLIVHGNATMEYFSDDGYAYLGELFASRGMIAVSVDENFLNYSQWSGVPKNDMLVRAWILMKHLQQIQQFSIEEGNPFYAQVDWNHVGLVGHSRGGQAIVMAANYESWFKDDESIQTMQPIEIKALAALAPTDNKVDAAGSYRLNDVYYLVLQGAKDADVSNFYGARQYNRTAYTSGSERFKASVYIAGANHSFFNTDWGTLDLSVPGGLFLTNKGLIKKEEQRQLTQVYLSAFFETAFYGNDQYRKLFQDYRYGWNWLPETTYFTMYEDGRFRALTRFDSASDTPDQPGILSAAGAGVELAIEQAKHRRGTSIGTKGLLVQWESEGSYSIELPKEQLASADWFIFSMANLEHELNEQLKRSYASIDIEFEQDSGENVRRPLSDFMPMYRSVETTFTRLPELEQRMKKGAYRNAAEAAFQTFHIPLAAFVSDDHLEDAAWTKVTFHFMDGPGKVMLDNIGWSSDDKGEENK